MQKHTLLQGVLSVFIVLSLFSCTQRNSNDIKIIKAMEENLVLSNSNINLSTQTILKSLQDKTTDWSTSEKAKIWYAKAEIIAKESNNLYTFINKIKKKQEINNATFPLLNKMLVSYKETLLNIDSSIWDSFKDDFFGFVTTFQTFPDTVSSSNSKQISERLSTPALSAALALLQNNIKINENKLIGYCHSKVGSTDGDGFFDSYSAIVGQSSNYLKPRDNLEIYAGVGAFSKAVQPKININGKVVELGDEGFALYKIKASSKTGKHSVPVKIDFFNQTTGKDESRMIYVEYTVAKPCN